jgi:SAM-dependent methyltransferase
MRAFVSLSTGEAGKFECIVRSFRPAFDGSVLDVGSRSGNLKRAIGRGARYTGIDIGPPANVIANLERGLPFASKSFDTVVALDVLEHTDDIHAAFAELLRVGRQHVVIALPNAFELKARLNVMRGRHVSGKYGLPPEARPDRHRWFFGFHEADRFCRTAERSGWHVQDAGALVGPRRGIFSPLVRRWPELFGPSYLVWLSRA